MRRALLLVLLVCCNVASAQVDPSLFQDLKWRLLGPFRGGRTLAVAGDPTQREHFYFGSVNGGVWETRDAGRTWQPIFDEQPVGSIGALALAPSDPKTIYVGTGESDMRSDISQGEGMFRSRDGGAHWDRIGLTDTQQIARILVHPEDPDLVYVAALGHPYGPNRQRGVFRSRDGGAHWEPLLGDADTGAIDLAFEPGNPRTIYAALWQTRRTPWSVYPPSSGPRSALYKSVDGGNHWASLEGHGLPARHGRIGIAIPRTQPQRVYVTVDAEPGGGVYRSDDGGAHFALASGDTRLWQRGWYFGELAADPKNPDRVYAMNTIVLRSDDGARTFVPLKGDSTGDDFHAMWIDPNDPDRQMLGVDQGALVTLNGGATWSSWHNQPTGQFYHVSTDTKFPYNVYGAQQDSGAASVPSRTHDPNGITMMQFREVTAGGESDNIAPDPDDPDVIFGGRVNRLDLRTQQSRDVDPTLAYPGMHRHTWTLPLVFSRRDPKVLYFANQRIYRTADGGAHWDAISPDLTRENPATPRTLDPTTAALTPDDGKRRGVVYAIAPSRLEDGGLWAGTDDGRIWRTRDEGKHWVDVTPHGLGAWSKVGVIETSRFDADVAYAAIDRHRLDDFAPSTYRTRDGGKSWTLITDGIARTHAVNVVREDTQRRGLLYAGTERGVYVSFDDGARWQPLQQNLPRTSVRDIDVHENDIVVATHGRAFWALDDVAPLRALAADAGAATRLLPPSPAVRHRLAGFTGTPFPKDEAMASNPAYGAAIDYVLASRADSPVVLEILDARGALVRRYSSDVEPAKVDLAKLTTAPEWHERPSTLSAAPGMHRFHWPLRFAAPEGVAEGDAYADGVWAPPGEYRLKLTVSNATFEQTLVVRPDPRVKIDAAAYARQFELATKVMAQRERVAAATASFGKVLKAIVERRKTAPSGALDALEARVRAVAGAPAVTNPSNGWWRDAEPGTLRYAASALEKLSVAVDGADADPSADAIEGLAKLMPIVEKTLAAWDKVAAEPVP